jgi:hypothetical protein
MQVIYVGKLPRTRWAAILTRGFFSVEAIAFVRVVVDRFHTMSSDGLARQNLVVGLSTALTIISGKKIECSVLLQSTTMAANPL